MHILESELTLRGYRRCGLVCPDPTPLHFVGRRGQGLFKVEITQPIEGWVTYIHVLENEFKKAGKTENDQSFAGRMKGSYNSMRTTIDLMNRGLLLHVNETLYHVDSSTGQTTQPYEHDFPAKHRVPLALLARRTVLLWAKQHQSRQAMLDEEKELNLRYRGEWAKEGWSRVKSADGRPVRTRIDPEE